MAGFGFSPADIVEAGRFSYRAYKEASNAPARYATARHLANCFRKTLDEITVNDEQVNETATALGLYMKLANNAYKDLDDYLSQFSQHLDQQRKSSVRASGVVARVRWTISLIRRWTNFKVLSKTPWNIVRFP